MDAQPVHADGEKEGLSVKNMDGEYFRLLKFSFLGFPPLLLARVSGDEE